jgi:hypothetical protein
MCFSLLSRRENEVEAFQLLSAADFHLRHTSNIVKYRHINPKFGGV